MITFNDKVLTKIPRSSLFYPCDWEMDWKGSAHLCNKYDIKHMVGMKTMNLLHWMMWVHDGEFF